MASNNQAGGLHFTLIDPQLNKIIYLEHEKFKKIEGVPFADLLLEKGINLKPTTISSKVFYSTQEQNGSSRELYSQINLLLKVWDESSNQ